MRLWVGFFLLVGSLLLAIPIVLVGVYLVPLLLLLVLPAGGLLLATGLIVTSPQPLWAQLLVLSPVLGPGLLLAAAALFMPAGDARLEAPADPVVVVVVVLSMLLLARWLLRCPKRKRVGRATWQPEKVVSTFPSTPANQQPDERIPLLARRFKQPPSP
jgi:hypothetical protein